MGAAGASRVTGPCYEREWLAGTDGVGDRYVAASSGCGADASPRSRTGGGGSGLGPIALGRLGTTPPSVGQVVVGGGTARRKLFDRAGQSASVGPFELPFDVGPHQRFVDGEFLVGPRGPGQDHSPHDEQYEEHAQLGHEP